MLSMTMIFARGNRFFASSVSALIVSAAMITGAGAANIATTYNESCAACHDSGA